MKKLIALTCSCLLALTLLLTPMGNWLVDDSGGQGGGIVTPSYEDPIINVPISK